MSESTAMVDTGKIAGDWSFRVLLGHDNIFVILQDEDRLSKNN